MCQMGFKYQNVLFKGAKMVIYQSVFQSADRHCGISNETTQSCPHSSCASRSLILKISTRILIKRTMVTSVRVRCKSSKGTVPSHVRNGSSNHQHSPVRSTCCSGLKHRKHLSSAFQRGIHWSPERKPHYHRWIPLTQGQLHVFGNDGIVSVSCLPELICDFGICLASIWFKKSDRNRNMYVTNSCRYHLSTNKY